MWASSYGHLEVVQLLLQEDGIDINIANKKGRTALYLASKAGHHEVVQLILEENGIGINKVNTKGESALYWASRMGHNEVVKLLLEENGVDINKANNKGETALYPASKYGYYEVVQLLLERKDIDVNKARHDGLTAIYLAVYYGYAQIAQLLLQSPEIYINREYNNKTVLWIAADKGHTELVQLLLEHPNTNITRGTSTDESSNVKIVNLIFYEETTVTEETKALFVAALLGNVAKVSSLLQSNRANVNSFDSFDSTPLFWASTRGHHDVVEVLLGQANILVNVGRSSDGANSLYQASRYGLLDTFNTLLEHQMIHVSYANLEKKTSLMIASIYGNSEVVKKLLSLVNIDVNHATFDGITALTYAVLARQQTILELLLRCPKTNTNLQNEEYMTALQKAKEMNYTDLIPLFGARGTLQITKGHTCCSNTINRGLHVAVENGDLPWVNTFLVCPGIEINIHNKDGYTPLNFAIERGLKYMVRIFLADQRIDVNKPNTGQKQNALLIASEGGHIDIIKMLLLHNQTFVNKQNAKSQSALSMAIQKYDQEREGHRKYFRIVKLLLWCPKTEVTNGTFGSDIEQVIELRSLSMGLRSTCCLNVNGSLLGAAWAGDFRAIKGLLQCPESKSNVNTADKKGRTLLYIASMMGHLEAVQVLIQNIDVNANKGSKIDGGTAFSIASEKSHFDVMRALIKYGKSHKSNGWCSSQWTRPCQEPEDRNTMTITPATILPSSGEVFIS